MRLQWRRRTDGWTAPLTRTDTKWTFDKTDPLDCIQMTRDGEMGKWEGARARRKDITVDKRKKKRTRRKEHNKNKPVGNIYPTQ